MARKQPPSLVEIAGNLIVDSSFNRWVGTEGGASESEDACASSVLECLPRTLTDLLVKVFLQRYVEAKNRGNSALPKPTALLELLGLGRTRAPGAEGAQGPLSALDLSVLIRLGPREHAELVEFDETFMEALPRLGNLVRLSLMTHGKDYTLPMCSDRALERIGTFCPRLRVLDLSHNVGVSADGLQVLCAGCPLLQELYLFDCVLPTNVIAAVLDSLPDLRHLGHNEVGLALMRLFARRSRRRRPLRLTHIANIGERMARRPGGAQTAGRLRCDSRMARALAVLCPALDNLKVRVKDEDVRHLAPLRSVTKLELRFHAGASLGNPGSHTFAFLEEHGARLVALTILCHRLHAHSLVLIGQHCGALEQLWLRVNQLTGLAAHERMEAQALANKTAALTRLRTMYLRVGRTEHSEVALPAWVLQTTLRHAAALEELYVAVNSRDVNLPWLDAVLGAFDASQLVTLYVLLPNVNSSPCVVDLSMAAVDSVRRRCPRLRVLGNLLVWNVLAEEVRQLQEEMQRESIALEVVYKPMKWK